MPFLYFIEFSNASIISGFPRAFHLFTI
jgi:hypothetical protein